MIDISLIAQDIIDGENTFKTSPDTYDRSKFNQLSHSRSLHSCSCSASLFNDVNIFNTNAQQSPSDTNAQQSPSDTISQQTSTTTTESNTNASDDIIVKGGYVTQYFDMNACKSLNELLKAERKKYVNAANLTGGSTVTLKNHSKSLNMYPFTLNLLQ